MTITTQPRAISASQVKTSPVIAGWHVWNIYLPGRAVFYLDAIKDDEGLWVVSTRESLNVEKAERAKVKSLSQVRAVAAWLYNEAAGVEQEGTLEEAAGSAPARRKASAAVSPQEAGVKVGDFFYSSWGYDQTNIDFYEVVGLTPKGVKVRKAWKTVLHDLVSQEAVVPMVGMPEDGEVETKILRGSAERPYLSLTSYSSAWRWDGKPKYQTSSGWGH